MDRIRWRLTVTLAVIGAVGTGCKVGDPDDQAGAFGGSASVDAGGGVGGGSTEPTAGGGTTSQSGGAATGGSVGVGGTVGSGGTIASGGLPGGGTTAIGGSGGAGGAGASVDSISGLVAHYPFDGNADDATSYANHGSPNNVVSVADRSGNAQGAYQFNGTTSYVEVPDAPQLHPASITVAVWARLASFTSTKAGGCVGQYIFFKRSTLTSNFEGYKVSFDGPPLSANAMVASSAGRQIGAGTGATLTMTVGSWYHLTMTADDTALTMYVDGVAVSTAATGFQLNVGTRPLFIGRSGEWFEGFLNGEVDDLRVYDRVLAPDEVRILSAG